MSLLIQRQNNNDYDNFHKPTQPPRRIFCHNNCHEYTLSIEPIIIRRFAISKFHIIAKCEKCKKFKSVVKSDFEKTKFPSCFFKMKSNEILMNEIDGKKIIEEISYIING